MIVVYKIETNKYDPISYGTNYLYNEFDRIQSFLIKQNAQRYKNILAKPVLSNGSVQWYANFNQPFSRINELNADAQVSIKKQYWEFRQHIDKEIQQLSLSRETEKQNWGGLLKEVFNEDDNVILSDGTDWCLLWGWKFRNTQENYLSPEFMPKPVLQESMAKPLSSNSSVGAGLTPLAVPLSNVAKDVEDNVSSPSNANIVNKAKPSLWDRVKRFLRTAVYRLWGLMFLIMFILFLMCLFKTCNNQRMEEQCKELEKNNQSLLELQKKVHEKCIEKKK
jgi:hypothetical protein